MHADRASTSPSEAASTSGDSSSNYTQTLIPSYHQPHFPEETLPINSSLSLNLANRHSPDIHPAIPSTIISPNVVAIVLAVLLPAGTTHQTPCHSPTHYSKRPKSLPTLPYHNVTLLLNERAEQARSPASMRRRLCPSSVLELAEKKPPKASTLPLFGAAGEQAMPCHAIPPEDWKRGA
jgi:hypothetical protein